MTDLSDTPPRAQQARLAGEAGGSEDAGPPRTEMDCDAVHRNAEGAVGAGPGGGGAVDRADEDRAAWEAGAPGMHPQGAGTPDTFPDDVGAGGQLSRPPSS